MRKRIAVVGPLQVPEKLQTLAAKEDIAFVPLRAGASPQPGTVGVISQFSSPNLLVKSFAALGGHYESLLELVAEAIDCRESYAPGSSQRVREHALRFAGALGLGPDDTFLLERAALVRDIGKLRIPNEVLLKDGPLTYDEWMLLRQHVELGADLAAELPVLADTAEIIRSHHECFDGDGYPGVLKGEQIPFLARVMKILDVYCAMTSARHYRKSLSSHEQALEHLRIERGKHFDPELIDVFIDREVGTTG